PATTKLSAPDALKKWAARLVSGDGSPFIEPLGPLHPQRQKLHYYRHADQQEKPQWYQKEMESINPQAQRLLENYSGITPAEVLPHVLKLVSFFRTAFKRTAYLNRFSATRRLNFHYPCIGQLRFLSFNLSESPHYPRVIERLRKDPATRFLDAGCCFGQEIRFLADQGILGKQLYGIDLEQAFLALGYQLFLDKDRLQATLIAGDILRKGQLSQEISGKIDINCASSLLHLWDYETQLKAAVRFVSLCRDQPDVMVVGRQMGSLSGGHYPMSGVKDEFNHYRNNVETMKGLWRDVEEATQTRWKVEAQLYMGDEIEKVMKSPFADGNVHMVPWCATRQ
ncbi:hypothetical protein N7532_009495, partial [Penicillium argentinense]